MNCLLRCGLLAAGILAALHWNACLFAADPAPAAAAAAPTQAELEKKFAEALSGATMIGHYTNGPIDKNTRLDEDRYTLTKVSKVSGDLWLFEARIQVEGHDVALPVPLHVLWAGDTPVITLDDLALPGLGTFSTRIVIHGHQYAGVWTHGDKGGEMFGRIEREKTPEKSETK